MIITIPHVCISQLNTDEFQTEVNLFVILFNCFTIVILQTTQYNIISIFKAYTMYIHDLFIGIEAQELISYKRFLTRHLYEPFPHFIQGPIYFRVLSPCIYLGPGIYMSPAFIWINTVLFTTASQLYINNMYTCSVYIYN